MNTSRPCEPKGHLRQVVVAVALAFGSISAWALPAFTLDPMAASPSLNGSTVTADNIVVSDYAHVQLNPVLGTFTESGLLSVQSFQLGGQQPGFEQHVWPVHQFHWLGHPTSGR